MDEVHETIKEALISRRLSFENSIKEKTEALERINQRVATLKEEIDTLNAYVENILVAQKYLNAVEEEGSTYGE